MITISLQQSRVLNMLLVLVAGLAIATIYFSPLSSWLSIFVIMYLCYLLRPHSYKKIMFIDHNHCACYKVNGEATMMRLDKETIFTRWFVILCLREVGGRKHFAWVSTRLDAQWVDVLKIYRLARCLV